MTDCSQSCKQEVIKPSNHNIRNQRRQAKPDYQATRGKVFKYFETFESLEMNRGGFFLSDSKHGHHSAAISQVFMPQTLHASREQLSQSEDAREAVSGVALGGSLLLHLGIIGLIILKQPDAKLPASPLPEVSMTVSITSFNPQRKQPSPPATTDIDVDDPVAEVSPRQQVEETEPVTEATAVEQTAGIDQSPATSTAVPTAELPDNPSVENPGTPGIGAAEVNNSVTAYIATYKGSLTSDWLSACLQYQNEHGVKTCLPGEDGKSATTQTVKEATSQLFSSYVSGAAANARASKKLLGEMDAMRDLMNESSVMGELARQRYQLAEANYCRLNSCRSFAISAYGSFPSFPTAISNEGFINIAGFGSGAASILSGLMSFMPEPKPVRSAAPFVPYRFTGTRTEQAESEDEFKVKAPVFPVRR
jgi:hypothetical protein